MKIIPFELRKMFGSNIFKALVIGVFVLISLYYAITYINSEKIMGNLVISEQNTIDVNEEHIQSFQALMNSDQVSDEEAEKYEVEIEMFEKLKDDAQKRLDGLDENEWGLVLETHIDDLETLIDQASQFTHSSSGRSVFTLESHVSQLKQLKERNIEPVFPIDYSTTIYDQFDSAESKEAAEIASEQYSADSLFFQMKLYDLAFGTVGVLFFILLFANMISKEGYRNGGPINLLHTQPFKRWKLYVAKFVASLMVVMAVMIGVMFLSVLLGFTFDRIGDWNYPILKYEKEQSFSFLNLGTLLLQSIILFLIVVIFSISLYFLISMFIKNTIGSIAGIAMFFLIGIGFAQQSFLSHVAHWNPFSYFPVVAVIRQEKSALLDNWDVTFGFGSWLLLASTLLIWVIICLCFFVRKNRTV